ncbi:MAG: DUF169 domain-containing protein [Candidatus Zipacnadales bacterium]
MLDLRVATAELRERIGLRAEPLAFFYTDRRPDGYCPEPDQWACVVAVLGRARRGETVYFDRHHFGCGGGGYYLGFCPPRPGIAEFVSTGIPGEMEGERYKQSPELVSTLLETYAAPPAPANYAVVKLVSELAEDESPAVVICFVTPDELAGLVFLAGFGRSDEAVICPFSSGCGSLITHPLLEAQRAQPRAVLGLFDPSARPFVAEDELSFAAPQNLWLEMLQNAPRSYLTTDTWSKLRERIMRRR